MFKLVVLSVFIAVAAAKPGATVIAESAIPLVKSALIQEAGHVEIHEPTLAKVGDLVERVPTAVSHQSSTIVHGRADKITPIIAPAVRTYSAPALKTYTAPIIETAAAGPLLKAAPAEAFLAAPYQLRTYAAASPYAYAYSYGTGPLLYSAPQLAYAL